MSSPVIFCCAPNGARRGAPDHPAIPLTPERMADTARRCVEAGAAMLHCHARDAEGRHSLDPELNRVYVEAVRRAVGDELIVQVTTEAAGVYGSEAQIALVRTLRPESVSVALRELCPDETAEHDYADLLSWARDEGVCVQHIVYGEEELRRFLTLQTRGVIPDERPFLLFVLGRYRGVPARACELTPFLTRLAGLDWPWMVCAFGEQESACAVAAAALGGHARIGFENNLQAPDGRIYTDNADAVATVSRLIGVLGVKLADAGTARRMLGIG